MDRSWFKRSVAGVAGLGPAVSSLLVPAGPALGHGNTCGSGNADYVVIVFVDGGQSGSNDDTCWINTHAFDEEFSVNEAGVDDIGENANFHDAVSSMSVKNFGADGLCVKYYQDSFRSVLKEKQWVGSNEGDIHFGADFNDNYDSLALSRVPQSTCLN